jgi:hypothetical protein
VDLSMAIPGSDWLEVPTIYVWPKNKAKISGNIPRKYGLTYVTNVPSF